MEQRHILIADDTETKRASLRQTVNGACPNSIIHEAGSVKETLGIIGQLGDRIDTALFDFDFEAEHETGDKLIRAHREKNKHALILCVTARPEGESFDDCTTLTTPAGANENLCFLRPDCSDQVQSLIRMT